MKQKLIGLSQRYVTALRKHLKQGSHASLQPARGWGRQAAVLDLETLDVAKIHEGALATLEASSSRDGFIKRAEIFFAEAITPIEETHHAALKSNVHLSRLRQTLGRRTVDLAASHRSLKQDIVQRKTVEQALKKSGEQSKKLLKESRRLQKHLHGLTHQILSAQEDKRKQISRELHNEIAQTLTGINIQLAALKTESTLNNKDLQKKISSTQRLVEKSVDIVHRFAQELRPTVLDDLGLIPAVQSFMKSFTKRTGVRASLTAFAAVEQLDTAKRTVLFRIAQEALTNVARHAHASRVEVSIQKLTDCICMKIADDGKSFNVERVLHSNGGNHLGLLNMRERLEMVGGKFVVESSPGKGTTVQAQIPIGKARGGLMQSAETKP